MGNKKTTHKIVVVGVQGSGKSMFCRQFEPRDKGLHTNEFNFFQHQYTANSLFEIWDLSGKHPHLWSHHFKNADGFVFVID